MANDALSKKQQQVLDFIKAFIEEKNYGPSVREIAEGLNLNSPSTVHNHLKNLEEKGYIVRDPKISRSISLPEEPSKTSFGSEAFSNTLSLPLVGNVAAGEPIYAEENITDTLTLPTEIVGDSASFILSVRGESMIEAGINDGDYIVVKEQNTARNGEIVVALIEDGATVKRFFKESDYVRLQPENSSMEPIITRECSIVGKVVAVLRKVY